MRHVILAVAALLLAACSNEGGSGIAGSGGSGGAPASGGASAGSGGATATSGGASTGGAIASAGGATSTGGAPASGGAPDPASAIPGVGDRPIGTDAGDRILGLAADAEGNLIASGFERGIVGATDIEPAGDSRAFVLKVGPGGAVVWKAAFDTGGADVAEDVAIDPATGGLVVLGRTDGAFPTFTNQGQFDLFLGFVSPDGEPTGVFEVGNERPQHPARLSLGRGGTAVVAGWDDTYIPSNFVAAIQDGFFSSFQLGAGAGVTQTSLRYIVPPAANAPLTMATGVSIDTDGSGDAYVGFLVHAGTGTGIFVSQLRGDHTVGWTTNLSPVPFDAVNAIALSPAGELFVTGGTFLALGAQSFGQEDAFVAQLDRQTGAVVRVAQAGGAATDYPTALGFDSAGNVYISGITYGSVVDGVPNQGRADLFAMKFDGAGALRGVWQAGTEADDQATSLAVDRCGRAFVGGYTSGALIPGQASAGSQDAFILQAAF